MHGVPKLGYHGPNHVDGYSPDHGESLGTEQNPLKAPISCRQDFQSIEDYIQECENKLYDTYEHNAEKYEQLLEEFTTRLHQNHYLGKSL